MIAPLILAVLAVGAPADRLDRRPMPAESVIEGWFVVVTCDPQAPDCPEGTLESSLLPSEAAAAAEADLVSAGGCWIVPSSDPAVCNSVRATDGSRKLAAGAVLGLRLRSIR